MCTDTELHAHTFTYTVSPQDSIFLGIQAKVSFCQHKAGPATHSWRLKSVGVEDAQHLRESKAGSLMKGSLLCTNLSKHKNPEVTKKQRKKQEKELQRGKFPGVGFSLWRQLSPGFS